MLKILLVLVKKKQISITSAVSLLQKMLFFIVNKMLQYSMSKIKNYKRVINEFCCIFIEHVHASSLYVTRFYVVY